MIEFGEHAAEPVPGLPEALPRGEAMLWQGRPRWQQLAVSALHVRKVLVYFVLLLLFRLFPLDSGMTLAGFFTANAQFLVLSMSALGLLVLLSWFFAKTTLYTITNRRVVLRFGVAFPVSINLPFSKITSADLRKHRSGSGDIALTMDGHTKMSYFVMWPHAKPWQFSKAAPMLRCLPDSDATAALLANALVDYHKDHLPEPVAKPQPVETNQPVPLERPFPLPPLIGVAALLIISVASIAWFRLSSGGVSPAPITQVVASVDLLFEDAENGSVIVKDAESGQTIADLESGTHGFVRATLRGLVRGRTAEDIQSRAPFSLVQTQSGQLLLIDTTTQQRVDLRAFGETNAGSFMQFLKHKNPALTVSQVDSNPDHFQQSE